MIIKKNNPSLVEFDELAPGDVFVEIVNGKELVQMKIAPVTADDGITWNCVSLDDGTVYYTKPTRQVCWVVAELNIR